MSIGFSLSSLSLGPAPLVVRRFTIAEYHRMAEAGVLGADDRVELLEGVVAPKMIHNPPHDSAVGLVEDALRSVVPAGWWVRIQSSLTTADSEPEPDVALVRGRPRDYARRHPGGADAALVVEVADSSLERDRFKARIYARAGVATYWVVNLVDRCIEIHASPVSDADGARYQNLLVAKSSDQASCTLPDGTMISVDVADLLP